MNWKGVMPAITTSFSEDLHIDHDFMAGHCRWLLENGCAGMIALGSLGEGATLSFEEKLQVLRTCVLAVHGRSPVVASVSALTTSEAIRIAKAAADLGCDALMVLPPYVYQGNWREMKTHVAAVFEATPLSCMLYNNPVAYGTDFLPEQNRALTSGGYPRSARCSTVVWKYLLASMTRCSKPLELGRPVGSPGWSTHYHANPSTSSTLV